MSSTRQHAIGRTCLVVALWISLPCLVPVSALGQPAPRGIDADGMIRLLVAADPASLDAVPNLRVRSCRRGLCTVEARAEELDEPLLRDVAAMVERGGQRRPMLDRSVPMAGVTDALRLDGITGVGVLVVVIDSGIDWRHPDFAADDDTSTRIELIVDLSHPPTGRYPELESVIDAAVWTGADIEAQLAAEAAGAEPEVEVLERDTFGHGTHVASVAAGSRGVAPEASLLIVRAAREDWPVTFEDADVLDAARFAFDMAEDLGMPAVVILALGGHQGPHDGTSLLELGLSELVGPEHPGRAMVVAAGNSGGCQDHARGELDGDAADVVLEVTSEDPSLAVDLELWAPSEATLELTVTTPDGERVGPVGARAHRSETTDAAWINVSNSADGLDERNGDRPMMVSLQPQLTGAIEPGQYRVTVSGHGTYDAYLSWTSSEQLSGAARLLTHLEPDGTLTVPGTAPELIVVGATVSRRGWTDVNGRDWLDDRFEVGSVAPYSGSGPNRAGDLKPDLVAPGHAIIAALSRDAEPGSEGSLFTPSSSFLPERYLVVAPGDRAVLWGTSLAVPHVAGVAALLLQLDPELTQDQLRSIMIASARTSGGAAQRAWNPRWGFGELDAEAAVHLLRDGFAETVSAAQSAVGAAQDVLAPDSCTTITVVPKDSSGAPIGPGHDVVVNPGEGLATDVDDGGDGVYTSRFCTGSAGLGTVVELSATVNGVVLDQRASIMIAMDRAHAGAWATATGGCTAVAAPPRSRLAWLAHLVP